jgi:hypothetical protein
MLAGPAVEDVDALVKRFTGMAKKSPNEISNLYAFEIRGLDCA